MILQKPLLSNSTSASTFGRWQSLLTWASVLSDNLGNTRHQQHLHPPLEINQESSMVMPSTWSEQDSTTPASNAQPTRKLAIVSLHTSIL